MQNSRSIYLDHAATTPLDPRVLAAMMPSLTETYGNSSSAHRAGRAAERAVEDAREQIAQLLNCSAGEIVFTSGGTESDNLAVRGAAFASAQAGRRRLITTPIEHGAVGKTVAQLAEHMGFEQTLLPVDATGRVDPEDLAAEIDEDTALVSIMYANNEVGTIEPVPQLAAQAHARGVLFHTDAVQAVGQLPLDVQALGVDMLSLSAHKFYGPKGIGLLFVRAGIGLVPSQSGGSHEEGRRAGTLNTPGIVGMAEALRLAFAERDERAAHYRARRDQLIDALLTRIPDAQLTGHPDQRLASHASFVFSDVDGSRLLMHLDMKGVAASSASACKTGNPEPSGVLLAMGFPRVLAASSLRLTVGKDTTEDDIETAAGIITESVAKLRKLAAESRNVERG